MLHPPQPHAIATHAQSPDRASPSRLHARLSVQGRRRAAALLHANVCRRARDCVLAWRIVTHGAASIVSPLLPFSCLRLPAEGFRGWGVRVCGSRGRVQGPGSRVQGPGSRVQGP
eukprot:1440744-Rhodomonas_salina.1